MIYVYILLGVNGRHYTGITNDITRRLDEHRKGQSKSTRRMLPVKMVYCNLFSDRIKARRQEVRIKNQGAGLYLKSVKLRLREELESFNMEGVEREAQQAGLDGSGREKG